jgi:hypothetical protein
MFHCLHHMYMIDPHRQSLMDAHPIATLLSSIVPFLPLPSIMNASFRTESFCFSFSNDAMMMIVCSYVTSVALLLSLNAHGLLPWRSVSFLAASTCKRKQTASSSNSSPVETRSSSALVFLTYYYLILFYHHDE